MPDFAFSMEASPMATNDLIPLFLSDQTVPEQAGILKAWDRAVIAPRILKTAILFVTASAIVFAVLSERNPSVLFANATAFLVGTSAPQDGAQSMPTIQSTADAQALPPTASEAPTGEEMAAAFKTASQSKAEIREPTAEALLKQFQAWAAEEDSQALVRPEQPVQEAQAHVQDDQPEVVQNARAQIRPEQEHRHVKPVHNARAGIRPEHNARAKVRPVQNARAQMRREQNARIQVRPVQNTQAQVQPVQNAQPPWLLQSLGWMD
jgi:hypothetical protein